MLRDFWLSWQRRGCLTVTETWQARRRTAWAMALLCAARLLVALIPFRIWRGAVGGRQTCTGPADLRAVRQLAAHIARATWRMPLAIKCLPQAIALSWQLRRLGLCHQVVFAVRPAGRRDEADALHAWVECGGTIVLGALPGPWITVHRQGSDEFACSLPVSDC